MPTEAGLEPAIATLKRATAVRLNLSGPGVDDRAIGQLTKIAGVESLALQRPQLTRAGWRSLSRWKNLRDLQLAGVPMTAKEVATLGAHRQLTRLQLGPCQLDRAAAEALGQLAALEDLLLFQVEGLDSVENCKHFAKLKRLQQVDVAVRPPSDPLFAALASLPQQRRLRVSQHRLTDGGAQRLGRMKALETLAISADSPLGERGIRALQKVPTLRAVNGIPANALRANGLAQQTKWMQALERDTSLDFERAPLGEVLRYLSQRHGVPLVAHYRSNKQPARVTLSAFGIRLRTALRLLLEPRDFVWEVGRDGVQIVPRAAADTATLVTRDYRLSHLVRADAAGMARIAEQLPRFVAPESWNRAQGKEAVLVAGERLRVTQSPYAHRKIEHLLEHLGPAALNGDPQEERALAILKEPVSLELRNVPLHEIVSFLADYCNLPIHLDRVGLKAAGLTVQQPLSVSAKDRPLADVLNHLATAGKLTWYLRDKLVVVTAVGRDLRLLETRVYHVGDLLDAESNRKADGIAAQLKKELPLLKKPGRLCETSFQRVLVRASFREHLAVLAWLSQEK